MVKTLRIHALVLLFQLTCLGSFAQGHLFSTVSVNQNAVYVGQPVEVTVSVYTSTWFTRGVDPGNIKVNGAFTIYFRSVSSTESFNGKTYAGVKMIFNVFPYDDEDLIFPSLVINVETPDEGTSKGIPRHVNTKSRTIVVKSVPVNYDSEAWMVSSGVSVKQNWIGDKNNVRVGSVIERYVVREVEGSVAELIPPIHWDTISGVSLYPTRAEVKNNKTRTAIRASRTDGIKYLFEEEGEIELPELVILWWNPQTGKMQKRTLKKVVLNVRANPDLGMLKSIRDSLVVQNPGFEGEDASKEKTRILGLSLREFIMAICLLLILLYASYKIFGPLKRALLKRREEYRSSERFYFNKFRKAARSKNKALTRQTLYRWIDQLQLEEPSLSFFAENYGNNALVADLFNVRGWSQARKNYVQGEVNKEHKIRPWINPLIALLLLISTQGFSQEFEPRSLTNIPTGTNFAMLGYGFASGNILFDPALPLEDVHARTHAFVGAYVRSLNFFGMGAKANVILPYATGNWEGVYQGIDSSTARSGMGDLRLGFSFNFIGSPALDNKEYKEYRQKTIAGFSMQLVAPTGQYFDDKLINLGSNRWAFRPQLGVSHKIKTWYIEYSTNVWIFSTNYNFWNGNKLEQKPIGTVKLHVIKSFQRRIWVALGAGYAFGGRSWVNNVKKDANISVMRFGVVVVVPVHPRHSLKLTAVTARSFEEGADFDSIGLTYQFLWN